MNRLKTLVVDDESLARKGLAIRLKEFEQLELMPECKTSREAVEIIVKEIDYLENQPWFKN